MSSKAEQLVNKLLIETENGLVEWEANEVPRSLSQDTEKSVPLFLKAEYKGKSIGVYDVRSKHFYDEHAFYWSESIGLCIVDDSDRVVWEANSYFPALLDLFNIARERAAGLDDILDDLV